MIPLVCFTNEDVLYELNAYTEDNGHDFTKAEITYILRHVRKSIDNNSDFADLFTNTVYHVVTNLLNTEEEDE